MPKKELLYVTIGQERWPARLIEVNGEYLVVPRGIARNNRSNSWQIKVAREGEVLISGSISDCGGNPAQSLSEAIRRIENDMGQLKRVGKEISKITRGGYNCKHAEPIRLAERVKLHWKVVDATPFLYCSVYSPLLGKTKTVSIGSDRSIAKNEELLICRVAAALAIGERVARNEDDPFRPVDDAIIDLCRTEAMSVTILNNRVADFIALGARLRENANRVRSEANGGLASRLAAQALNKARRVA